MVALSLEREGKDSWEGWRERGSKEGRKGGSEGVREGEVGGTGRTGEGRWREIFGAREQGTKLVADSPVQEQLHATATNREAHK
eukprot:418211-Rhodomonas_salina.1